MEWEAEKEHPSRGCRVMPFNVPAINLSEFAGTEALYTAYIVYPCAAIVGQQMRNLNGLQMDKNEFKAS